MNFDQILTTFLQPAIVLIILLSNIYQLIIMYAHAPRTKASLVILNGILIHLCIALVISIYTSLALLKKLYIHSMYTSYIMHVCMCLSICIHLMVTLDRVFAMKKPFMYRKLSLKAMLLMCVLSNVSVVLFVTMYDCLVDTSHYFLLVAMLVFFTVVVNIIVFVYIQKVMSSTTVKHDNTSSPVNTRRRFNVDSTSKDVETTLERDRVFMESVSTATMRSRVDNTKQHNTPQHNSSVKQHIAKTDHQTNQKSILKQIFNRHRGVSDAPPTRNSHSSIQVQSMRSPVGTHSIRSNVHIAPQNVAKRKRKRIITLSLKTWVCFISCWLPISIYGILTSTGTLNTWSYRHYFEHICFWFVFLDATLTPVFYIMFMKGKLRRKALRKKSVCMFAQQVMRPMMLATQFSNKTTNQQSSISAMSPLSRV